MRYSGHSVACAIQTKRRLVGRRSRFCVVGFILVVLLGGCRNDGSADLMREDVDRVSASQLIRREELPDDAADWHSVKISFDRLTDDGPGSCPESEDEIFAYVAMESADGDEADRSRFRFLRTAQVGDARYWLWEYTEDDGQVCYASFRLSRDGSSTTGLAEPNGLSPEQYLLADYYDEVYW